MKFFLSVRVDKSFKQWTVFFYEISKTNFESNTEPQKRLFKNTTFHHAERRRIMSRFVRVCQKGKRYYKIDESRFLNKSLLPLQALLRSASSKSTLENEKSAKKLLVAYDVKHNIMDPFQVNANSSGGMTIATVHPKEMHLQWIQKLRLFGVPTSYPGAARNADAESKSNYANAHMRPRRVLLVLRIAPERRRTECKGCSVMVLGLNMGDEIRRSSETVSRALTILSHDTTVEITESIKNFTELRTYKL